MKFVVPISFGTWIMFGIASDLIAVVGVYATVIFGGIFLLYGLILAPAQICCGEESFFL